MNIQHIESIIPINNLIQETCSKLNLPELSQKIDWKWNYRYTSCMGTASNLGGKYELQFSYQIYKLVLQQELTTGIYKCYENIVHEVCHVADFFLGNFTRNRHGDSWKNLMRKCGYSNPQRCHTIDVSSISKKRTRYTTYCKKCNQKYVITKNKYTKVVVNYNSSFSCSICKETLYDWKSFTI